LILEELIGLDTGAGFLFGSLIAGLCIIGTKRRIEY